MQMKSGSDKVVFFHALVLSAKKMHVEDAAVLALGRKLGIGGCRYFWTILVRITAENDDDKR
jgi:hypothetical protein